MKKVELPNRYIPVIAETKDERMEEQRTYYAIFDTVFKHLFVFAENWTNEYTYSEIKECFQIYGLDGMRYENF